MAIHTLRREQALDADADAVFAFFADPLNLEAITPPLLRFAVVTPGADRHGRRDVHPVPPAPARRADALGHARSRHGSRRGASSTCRSRGPYRLWHHTHELSPLGDGRTLMRDTVRYALGFGALGALAHRAVVRRDLEAIFAYRAERVPALLS